MIIFSVLSWSLLLIWQLNLLLNTTHIQKRFKKISVCLCLLVFFVFLLYDIVCSSYVPSPGTIQAIWQRDESHGGGGIPETGDALVSGLHLPSHVQHMESVNPEAHWTPANSGDGRITGATQCICMCTHVASSCLVSFFRNRNIKVTFGCMYVYIISIYIYIYIYI